MNKVRLTETQLRDIITESVKTYLNEANYGDLVRGRQNMAKHTDYVENDRISKEGYISLAKGDLELFLDSIVSDIFNLFKKAGIEDFTEEDVRVEFDDAYQYIENGNLDYDGYKGFIKTLLGIIDTLIRSTRVGSEHRKAHPGQKYMSSVVNEYLINLKKEIKSIDSKPELLDPKILKNKLRKLASDALSSLKGIASKGVSAVKKKLGMSESARRRLIHSRLY